MGIKAALYQGNCVTPRAGVWIEIHTPAVRPLFRRSLPVRECGLKYRLGCSLYNGGRVTPRAGVWIEIMNGVEDRMRSIESLPVRECGLKSGE